MGKSIHEQLAELNQQVVGLYKRGRYAEGMEFASRAYALARQHLGDEHAAVARSLNNLAMLHQARGEYAAAEPLYRQALAIARNTLGEKHPAVATSLNNLAEVHRAMGDYAAAEPLYRQALTISRSTLGEEHPDVARCLNNLGALYHATGNYAAADPLYRQALAIRRRAMGEDHPDLTASLNNLAALFQATGNYAAAEPLYGQALAISRKALGEDHPAVATSLDNLGGLHQELGNYSTAEPLYRQALAIRRKALREGHPDVATSLNSLAGLHRAMGNYATAVPLYSQALTIFRQGLGEAHPELAASLNGLAELHRAMGNYAAAEPLYRQALTIQRKALAEAHPAVAASVNNLALLYQAMGNHSAAEPLYREALAIWRKSLGEHHPDVAICLNNLAGLHDAIGDYRAAERLYRQALTIRRNALGAEHPAVARSLNNLAVLHQALGNYAAAAPLHCQALAIRRTAFGDEHPDVAMSLNNLAVLHHATGDYAAAEPLFHQALTIWRKTLGEDHPEVARTLNNLAALCVATAREREALALTAQCAAIDDRMIGQVFSIGSDNQRMAYLKTVETHFATFLSLVVQHLSGSATAVGTALELVLRRKAIGAEALAAQRDAVLGGRYPALAPALRELTTLRMQIAQKTLAGPGPEGLTVHQNLLAEWNAKKERLEADLARQIPEMNLDQKLRAVDRHAIALALPEGASLIEFVRFAVFDFKAVPAGGDALRKPARYVAFVMPAGQPDSVNMIDLGEAAAIDQMIAAFRVWVSGDADYQKGCGTAPEERRGTIGDDGSALRTALFDPLRRAIGTHTRLLLAPDGDLTRLPFEVLPTDDGGHLIDAYQLSYVVAGRDVLRFGAASNSHAVKPLVVADPDFDSGLETTAPEQTEASGSRRAPWLNLKTWFGSGPFRPRPETLVLRAEPVQSENRHPLAAGAPSLGSRTSRDLLRAALHFDRLAATQQEGERIATLLGAELWLGGRALETEIKAYRSPYILHLATHGFFLADQRHDPKKSHAFEVSRSLQSGEGGPLAESGLENPLLRSGLALAGVNTWLRHHEPPVEAEDGLLTAEDISGLDLLATELVVLSACDTGLGEIRIGEGVFGLRRAFVLAGAKTLVMSLWKVPDAQTQELMEDFYHRFLAGQPRADALRGAQLALKSRYSHPFYWGGFICQGDPGPLPPAGRSHLF